jgi:hypothetical protein
MIDNSPQGFASIPSKRQMGVEAALALCLFVAACAGATWYVDHYVGITGKAYLVDTGYYDTSLMVALGRGASVLLNKPEPIRRFLDQQDTTLDVAALPAQLSSEPLHGDDKFIYDRLYLTYAVGLTWRLFGISWRSLNYLMGFAYGICAVFLFGIFRLALRRPLSVLLTVLVLCSPAMLGPLPALREFMKAPFILGSIFAAGLLFSRPFPAWFFLALAVLSGLLVGVGVGFRQDAIICLPPAAASVLLAAGGLRRLSLRQRGLGLALLFVAFLLPAWPILKMNRDSGGNNAFYLAQGFSGTAQAELDLANMSYRMFYSHGDWVVHAALYCHNLAAVHPIEDQTWSQYSRRWLFWKAAAQLPINPVESIAELALAAPVEPASRGFEIWNKNAELAMRGVVYDLARMTPADVLTSWYGSTLRIVRCLGGRGFNYHLPYPSTPLVSRLDQCYAPVTDHLARKGALYALVALCLLATRRLWLAWVCLGFLLYFAGYPSLNFQYRHIFHLQFIIFWFVGVLLQAGMDAVGRLWRSRRAMDVLNTLASPALFKAVFLVLPAILLLALPLKIARDVQACRMAEIQDAYRHADLEPVSVRETPTEQGGKLYSPVAADDSGAGRALFREAIRQTSYFFLGRPYAELDYLAVEFSFSTPSDPLRIKYEGTALGMDGWVLVPFMGAGTPYTYRCFIPTYRFDDSARPLFASLVGEPAPKFAGIALGPSCTFKRLYRVKNASRMPFPMVVCLPDDPGLFVDHLELQNWLG